MYSNKRSLPQDSRPRSSKFQCAFLYKGRGSEGSDEACLKDDASEDGQRISDDEPSVEEYDFFESDGDGQEEYEQEEIRVDADSIEDGR